MGLFRLFSDLLARYHRYRDHRRTLQLQQLQARYQIFRTLLDDNHRAVELLTDLSAALRSSSLWPGALQRKISELLDVTSDLVDKLEHLTGGRSSGLTSRHSTLSTAIRNQCSQLPKAEQLPLCLPLDRELDNMTRIIGGKAAQLAGLRSNPLLSVPDGFTIPVSACRLFLEQNDLYLKILDLLREAPKADDGLPDHETIEIVKDMIMKVSLPPELTQSLSDAATPLLSTGNGLAVRSSAISEDSASHSFAGQYATVLNVTSIPQLETAFKTVVASAFNRRNLAYRSNSGLAPYEFDLAVLCLQMVNARASGILFSVDPSDCDSETMLISAVFGLGELAVSGSEAADIYRPHRTGGPPGKSTIARKERRLVSLPDGGVREEPLAPDAALVPVLSESEIGRLVQLAKAVEEQIGGALDIEWAVDDSGNMILLQARPLILGSEKKNIVTRTGRTPLLSGGQSSSTHRGAGQLKIIRSTQDLKQLTDPPYVLAMHQSLVEAVSVLQKVSAVLVDLGNPADHLSCVARESSIPMLTGLGNATSVLTDGHQLLVDGRRGAVFQATEQEIAQYRELFRQKTAHAERINPLPQDPVAANLHNLTVPLNLTDAYGPTFVISECRTIHDIVRYAHEKAVLAMFEAGDEALEKSTDAVVHLDSEVPFHVSLIDLGGGLIPGGGRRITADRIVSRPFSALWQGVLTPGLNWGPAAGGTAVGSVMSRFLTDHRSARPIGMPNYALVTRDFLNLNARMDFHFTMVDTICGHDHRLNYIKFRFKGGGTSLEQRRRRVRCLANILSANGFFHDLRDDLLTARIQGGTVEIIERKLLVIGQLLGFSRLLDAVMHQDDLVSKVASAFLEGDFQLSTLKPEDQKPNGV